MRDVGLPELAVLLIAAVFIFGPDKLPDLARQEIWAWLIVHYALAVLITQAAEAADVDPDRVSFTRALRIARRTATGTAGFSP